MSLLWKKIDKKYFSWRKKILDKNYFRQELFKKNSCGKLGCKKSSLILVLSTYQHVPTGYFTK